MSFIILSSSSNISRSKRRFNSPFLIHEAGFHPQNCKQSVFGGVSEVFKSLRRFNLERKLSVDFDIH